MMMNVLNGQLLQALHHEEIGKDPQRINKLKPFVSRYNWNGINLKILMKKKMLIRKDVFL